MHNMEDLLSSKKVIDNITIVMALIAFVIFCGLMQFSSQIMTPAYIDAIIYLITMTLITILLNWYNQGRYEMKIKRSRDYIELLIFQHLISAAGACLAILHIHGELEIWAYLLTGAAGFLNIGVMYLFGRFVNNYMEMNAKQQRCYVFFHKLIAVFSLVIALAGFLGGSSSLNLIAVFALTEYPGAAPGVLLCNSVWLILVGICIIRYVPRKDNRLSLLSYFFAVVPISFVYVISEIMDNGIWLPSLLSFFGSLALLIIFCDVYVERSKTLLRQQTLLREREKELIQSQINNMLLQINPHFLYNTLGSIKSLCVTDPERAADLVQQFSEYLQNNYADMARQQMVPFEKELEYLKQYLKIEQVRFPNLQVEYDIETEDFELPSLSVQPLAENAVRHGIGQRRRNAGTLEISTRETSQSYVIYVEDDGAGFDTSVEIKDDGRPHIGIANVRSRLKILCAGRLLIESEPGVGTKCTIIIDK